MSYHYQSADGLLRSNDLQAVAAWDQVGAEMAHDQARANAQLRAQGVKAAHPDDGWVDRQCNSVQFVYPAFDDGVQVGDLIALGWPWPGYRLVRVIGIQDRRGPLLTTRHYWFEQEGQS